MMDTNQFMQNIEDMISNGISAVHTACPATIVSFDAGTCIASVKPIMTYYKTDGTTTDYPIIIGVPVFMPRAGAAQITYPVKEGDSCLLVFSERSLDEWMGKGNADSHDPRRYDLTDAFCFVGMCPTQSISADNVEVINGGTKISLTPGNTINIVGNINVQGTITCTGDVIGAGISLDGHVHSYHHGTTSPPQ